MVDNTQKEVFIINDIDMEIGPSDIQVMDDNWVMEDSFLRSKSVFCYRSKYSATKVVLSIPFQISYLTEEDKKGLNNTYNCIRLISELDSYPFCFIKNNRIKAYVSPTSVSVTDYMIFAVDELAIVQDSKASNVLFLEVVLQYYNHLPLIKDFEFRSNLSVAVQDKKLIEEITPEIVESLKSSVAWKQYINPRTKSVIEKLIDYGFLDYTNTDNKSLHPMMGVKILAPTMSVINKTKTKEFEGRYVSKDAKIITVTDTSGYDDGTFENLLATLQMQDFSFDSTKFENIDDYKTINSEDRLKEGEYVTSKMKKERIEDSKENAKHKTIANPFEGPLVKTQVDTANEGANKLKESINRNAQNVFIDWVGHDIQALALGVQKIEVRKKNRLVTHQIGAFKHPVVQYMGKYPATVNVTMVSSNFEVYKDNEPPVNIFLKHVLNVLDYNRQAIPEAEAYNFLKIRSLATCLLNCESFLPAQNVVSASSASQGIESLVYSFHQGDLTDFIEQGRVESTNRNELNKGQARMTDIIVAWLQGFTKEIQNILSSSNSSKSTTELNHTLSIYKSIIQLTKEAMNETSLDRYPHYAALETASDYSSDLRPGNNVLRSVVSISNEYTKELEKFKLYRKTDVVDVKERPLVKNDALDSKYGGPDSSYFKEQAQAMKKGFDISTVVLHRSLIPFMIYVLKIRSHMMSGKAINLPSISFTPSGRFNNLMLNVISMINTGLQQGSIMNPEKLNNESVKEELNNQSENFAKVFFGYNIEDLDFEIFSTDGYDRSTDLLTPKIDPFFFIEEVSLLDGNEFEAIYDKMYKNEHHNQNLLTNINDQHNDEKGEADATATNYPLHYRKLEEIEYNPEESKADVEMMLGYYGGMYADNAALGKQSAEAKKVDPAIADAIEKALRKYGLDKDEGFRKYMYAILLKESTNGHKLVSSTGAVGLFQFTKDAVTDILNNKNNKLEYSNGSKVTSTSSASVKAASKNDYYLSSQLFIERYLQQKKSTDITRNGREDPFYAFVAHNIGAGSLPDIKNVLENGAISISSGTRTRIRQQSASFIGRTDKETVERYYQHMNAAVNVDNIPEYLSIDAKAITKSNATALVQNAKNTPVGIGVLSPAAKAESAKKAIEKQAQAVAAVNHEYKGITKAKADTTQNISIGSKTISGVVTKVVDGDTYFMVDAKTNKQYKLRVYGIDAADEGEIYKDNATKALSDLILGKKVSANLGGSTYDREVAVTKLSDGTDVSLTMLRNGYAQVANGYNKVGAYEKAQEDAKKNQKGIWTYPDKVITEPRKAPIDLTGKTATDLQNIKNNVNHERFTENDYQTALKAGKVSINSFQPFEGGKTYRVSSYFGMRYHPVSKKNKMHNGVDLACPSGTRVVASAAGTVTAAGNVSGYGGVVYIDHGNGLETRYAHLKQLLVKKGDKVIYLQAIGLSGGGKGDANRGTSTGAHLHYEVRFNGKPINPFGTKELNRFSTGEVPGGMINTTYVLTEGDLPTLQRSRTGVTEENTVYNEDALADAMFKNMYKSTNAGLKTSLPAIKVYMTIGNENDKFWLDTLKGDVLYYEVKGVKSFHMNCNNSTNPIDTAFLSIADPSFLNTDGFAGLSKMQGVNVTSIGTSNEIAFKNDRIQLKVGNKLHIRLGYGNSPNDLDVVFNGSIVEVENANQTLNLVCEGFGKELVSEVLATNRPEFMNTQNDNISTASVIGDSLIAETIEHFGYNSGFISDKLRETTDPEDRSLAPGRLSLSYNWFYDFTKASYKSRLFMNVFAPEIEKLDNEFNRYKGWISNLGSLFTNHMGGYPFAVYRMTPWDCMKQMEYRHPNTICKPMLYEDRMTLFYGIKEQTFFKRDLLKSLQIAAASQKSSNSNGFDLTQYTNRRRERMEPVSNIHLVTSSTNLINNGLRLSSDYATKIKVNYFDSRSDAKSQKAWDMEAFEAKADDNLYPFDIRAKELSLSGCLGRYSAFLYGTTELKNEAEKMYKGKITILGNSNLKAGDYIFIDDSEKRMHGLVLVRECYHHFDDKVGFMTEIVPGQYVEAANFLYSSLWLNMMCTCKIVTSKLKTIVGYNFSDSDFNMVSSYLTILKQAEIALDKISEREVDAVVASIYGANTVLSALLLNSVSKVLGLSDKNSILKFMGLNLSAGTIGFTKHFFTVFTYKVDLFLANIAMDAIRGKGTAFLNNSRIDFRGAFNASKNLIVSSELVQKIKTSKTSSGLIWKSSRAILNVGARGVMSASKIVGRALFSTVLAVGLANPISIALDVLFYMAVQYANAKVEENTLMRQPLLYYPIIRHGRPYVGGMAGVVRNTWTQSKILEGSKTIKEIQKASSILVGNSDNTNLSGDRPFYISILKGLGKGTHKTAQPLYQTDENGNALEVDGNKVKTTSQIREDTAALKTQHFKDEDNMRQLLIDNLNKGTVAGVL